MDVSNKTLAMFLVAAIVVSVAGTIISLNKLQSVSYTGFATTATGNVSVNIASQLSITTSDHSYIDFKNCTPQSGVGTDTINSEGGGQTSTVCSSFSDTGTNGEILVRNDGNVNANVTIDFSDVGEADGGTFLPSPSDTSRIQYKIINDSSASYHGGCVGSYPSSYTTVTNSAKTNRVGCTNLKYGGTYNSFQMEVQITLPHDADVGYNSIDFTFTAHNV